VIIGTVNSRLEILLRPSVLDVAGQVVDIEAVPDTGFTGALTLPPPFITSLGLPLHSRRRMILAGGVVDEFDFHAATILWDGQQQHILVPAVDSIPLVGMMLLLGYDLRGRIEPGGRVEIEEIP
jgi:predicted aspartyl protease